MREDSASDLPCVPVINVLYEDPTLLVLQSDYIDIIWKGVAIAQKEGYKIDSMTSYAASGVQLILSSANLVEEAINLVEQYRGSIDKTRK